MKQTVFAVLAVLAFCVIAGSRTTAQEREKSISVVTVGGHSKGGWLGVAIQDISSRLAKKKGLKSDEGAYVSDVVDDSPADSAGIKEGDVIVEFNGKKIQDADDLLRAVQKTKPGTKTTVLVTRGGDKKTIDLTVGRERRPKGSQSFSMTMPPMAPHVQVFTHSGRWGLELSELNEQLGEYFGAPNGHGLLVERVEKKSSGDKAGFKAGDVIVKVNKSAIEDMSDLNDALEDAEDAEKVDVEVLRKGSTQTISVETGDDDGPSSFNYRIEGMPGDEPMDGFQMFNAPGMDRMQMELRNRMPQLDGLKERLEELRESMTCVRV